jgi:hypothetical protein
MGKNDKPEWDRVEADVIRKLRYIQAAWEFSEKRTPELHPAMKRDLYIPALKCLAAFCCCVHDEESAV